jgi:uncharacterized protein (DUF1697 family)
MKTWIALVKGINVGGNNKILMKDLVRTCEALGFSEVRTYIQSGNIVFRASEKKAQKLSATISEAIQSEFDIRTSVMILSAVEMASALNGNPFPEIETDEDSKRLHLYFLSQPAARVDMTKLDAIRKPDERWELLNNVVYLHTPQGAGDSKLAQQVEKIVGVATTARNLRTVRALVDMTSSDAPE